MKYFKDLIKSSNFVSPDYLLGNVAISKCLMIVNLIWLFSCQFLTLTQHHELYVLILELNGVSEDLKVVVQLVHRKQPISVTVSVNGEWCRQAVGTTATRAAGGMGAVERLLRQLPHLLLLAKTERIDISYFLQT